MNSPLPSVADDIASKHWSAIAQIVASHPDEMEQQLAFARAVWLKAFEAGHAKGLEALASRPGPACPQHLMEALETALVDRRSAFLIMQATDLIAKMLPMLRPEDLAALAGTPKTIPQQRRRPDLKVVRAEEEQST